MKEATKAYLFIHMCLSPHVRRVEPVNPVKPAGFAQHDLLVTIHSHLTHKPINEKLRMCSHICMCKQLMQCLILREHVKKAKMKVKIIRS